MLWQVTVPPEVNEGGTPAWIVVLAIVMPVVGVIVSAYLGSKRRREDLSVETQARDDFRNQWEVRGQLIDELAGKLAAVTEARDAAVEAAETAHGHRLAAEHALRSTEESEEECRRQLKIIQEEMEVLRVRVEGLDP